MPSEAPPEGGGGKRSPARDEEPERRLRSREIGRGPRRGSDFIRALPPTELPPTRPELLGGTPCQAEPSAQKPSWRVGEGSARFQLPRLDPASRLTAPFPGMEVPGSGAELSLPPDLKDLEMKLGQKPPDGLIRWLRGDPAAHLLRNSPNRGPRHGLGEKIKALKVELAYLRTIDIKILHQLVAVNDGIEAVKWFLEEKGMLTSRCSSLTSSQYSLVESQDTSRRGSWNSLQDPNDKLDSISIGSYLDTLADDMDEYGQSSSVEPIMSPTSGRPLGRSELERSKADLERIFLAKVDKEQDKSKTYPEWASGLVKKQSFNKQSAPVQLSPPMANGILGRHVPMLVQSLEEKFTSVAAEQPSKGSLAIKASRSSKMDSENCKLNNRKHLEYDGQWQWAESQEDVTFL